MSKRGTRDGKITTIRPSDGPSNHGHTCVKGRYAFDYVYAEERITSPMIRRDGEWVDVSWDEVIKYIADRLAAIAAQQLAIFNRLIHQAQPPVTGGRLEEFWPDLPGATLEAKR